MARLIGFFLIFALFLAFIVLNLDNKCTVHFGFHTFENVPIYISAFISILLGMVISIPFMASYKKKKDSAKPPKIKTGDTDEIPGENGPYGIN